MSGFRLATENLWEWQIKCYEPSLNRGSRVASDAQKLSASVEPSLWLWEGLGLGEVLQGLYICSQTLVGTGGAASPLGGRCAATPPVSALCFYDKIIYQYTTLRPRRCAASSSRVVAYPVPIAPADMDAYGHHKLYPCHHIDPPKPFLQRCA